MRALLWSSVALLLVSSTLPAQTRTIAERLGHPKNAKLLILHADDLGVAHSENAASLAALTSGAINSASIMMPTPWVTEVANYAKANPNADLGLHLTLTSEWETYKWGSVASKDRVPSLLDPDGYFPKGTRTVATRAKIDEVEIELRAQIELALTMGIKPTHLDSHMGALFSTPALMEVYAKVARSYKLPFLAYIGNQRTTPPAGFTDKDIMLDAVIIAGTEVKTEQWKEFYLNAIRNLKPGLTEILVHLAYDDAEMRAVTVDHPAYNSPWRQRDVDVLNSAEFKQALKDNNVILVTWRDLMRLVQ